MSLPTEELPWRQRKCTIDGCDRKRYCRGWCQPHWRRWRRNGDPETSIRPTPMQRFESYVRRDPNGCWTWTGGLNSDGYGVFTDSDRRSQRAHRWAYEAYVRSIPHGKMLDHLCRNRACVNPAHLDLVTNRTNVLRGMSPSAVQYRTRICKRGHSVTEDNVYVPPRRPRSRYCRQCQLETQRKYDAKRRGKAAS